jgi:hypothetical protein
MARLLGDQVPVELVEQTHAPKGEAAIILHGRSIPILATFNNLKVASLGQLECYPAFPSCPLVK